MAAMLPIGPSSSFTSSHRFVLSFRSWRSPSAADGFETVLLYRHPDVPNEGPSERPQWYGIQGTCPHLGAPLEQGSVELDIEDVDERAVPIIMCPWHQFDFNMVSGKSSTGARACTYRVERRDDDTLWIESPGSAGDDYRLLGIRAVSENFADEPVNPPPPSPDYDLVNSPPKTIAAFARLVLLTADPNLKVSLTRELVRRFRSGELKVIGSANDLPPPDEPPRPSNVVVVEVGKAPKIGKGGTVANRVRMMHALASIEQWAIDLSLDVIARFWQWRIGSEDGKDGRRLPLSFVADFLKIAADEAKHFTLLRKRMMELSGTKYGDLPVHHGLWETARETSHSLFARLALVHLVHEARGLDSNPRQIARCKAAGDHDTAAMLDIIHNDEITHVAAGHRHFTALCAGLSPPADPVARFRELVGRHFYGSLRGPYNAEDREKAGMGTEWYSDLKGRAYGAGVDSTAESSPSLVAGFETLKVQHNPAGILR